MKFIEKLVTLFTLDKTQFDKALASTQRGLVTMGKVMKGTRNAVSSLFSGIGKLISPLKALFRYLAVGAAVGLVSLAKHFFEVYVQMESVRTGIKALVGDVQLSEQVFKRLMDVSNQPGVATFQQLTKAFQQLFDVSKDLDWTINLLYQFNNAMARGGRTTEEFNRAAANMSQILGAGKLTGDELREMSMVVPGFRDALTKEFGTGNSELLIKMGVTAKEVLTGVGRQFELLDRAIETPQTKINRLSNAWNLFSEKVGTMMSTYILPAMEGVQRVLTYVIDNFNDIFEVKIKNPKKQFEDIMNSTMDGILKFIEIVIRIVNTLDVFWTAAKELALSFNWVVKMIWKFAESLEAFLLFNFKKFAEIQLEMIKMYNKETNRDPDAEVAKAHSRGDGRLREYNSVRSRFNYQRHHGAEVSSNEMPNWMGGFFSLLDKASSIKAGDVTKNLTAIESNTRRTADLLDNLQRVVLGGGNLGVMGVTPVQLAGGGRSAATREMSKAMKHLSNAISVQVLNTERYG